MATDEKTHGIYNGGESAINANNGSDGGGGFVTIDDECDDDLTALVTIHNP